MQKEAFSKPDGRRRIVDHGQEVEADVKTLGCKRKKTIKDSYP